MNFREELAKELGLGLIPKNTMLDDYVKACEAIAIRYHESEVKKLPIHDVISCVCPNEIKTGTVSINCCNLCGKPDEDWWGKH